MPDWTYERGANSNVNRGQERTIVCIDAQTEIVQPKWAADLLLEKLTAMAKKQVGRRECR